MGKSVALLSGKGGSGKTTLSLSIAYLFAARELKVLLVDCDLLTTGATYFFEDRLSENKSVLTFADMLYGLDHGETLSPIKVNPYLDFIPSIRHLNEQLFFPASDNVLPEDRFSRHYRKLSETYDVLLFDCPAGFSEAVQYVTPHMDNNLVVLEADTISMAAMRSLYIKLATVVPDVKFYQIFNKIRKEEADKYSNRNGTFFTNIGAITFDWAIPGAFAMAEVPTVDSAGADFSMQLYRICTELFRGERYQNKLQQFHRALMLSNAKAERAKIEDEVLEYRTGQTMKKKLIDRVWHAFPLIFALLTTEIGLDGVFSENSSWKTVIAVFGIMCAAAGVISLVFSMERDDSERRMKSRVYMERLDEIDYVIAKLTKEVETGSPRLTGKERISVRVKK